MAALGFMVLGAPQFCATAQESLSSLLATALSAEVAAPQILRQIERPDLAMLFLKSDIATGMDL